MSKRILIIGGGAVGLSTAYYAARKGHRVTVLDRGTENHENCSYGNAGLVVPSHFVPLAAPGMVALGLKWMLKPDSPFYVKPRLDRDLLSWGFQFWRAANPGHTRRCAPLLRDLNVASRECFQELADLAGNSFGFERKGLLCLCQTAHRLEEESGMADEGRRLGLKVDVLTARDAARLDPNIRMEIEGAVYFHDDCHLTPARFMAALKDQVQRLGVVTSWST
jgi:D-amino-acid dehydrogenase